MSESRLAAIASAVDSVLARAVAALHDDGDLRAARALFEQAWQDAPGDPRAALGLAGLWVHEHRDPAAAATLERRLTQALTAVGGGAVVDEALRVRLRARIAAEAGYRDGNPAAVLAVLDAARACGDPVALGVAYNNLSSMHEDLGNADEARQYAELAAKISQRKQ